jgi:hypothetical protein
MYKYFCADHKMTVEFLNVIQIVISSLEFLVTCEYFNSVFQFLIAPFTYYCHVFGDHRQGFDWQLHLLDSYK